MIISRTPFRISFFGGGTDYPAWYLKHGGEVLGTTINKYCYITCRYLPPFFEHRHRIVYSKMEEVRHWSEIAHPAVREVLSYLKIERGVEIHHDGDLPARSGLGSSSAFTVGLLNALFALQGRMVNKQQLARESIYIEQERLKETVGSQDQVLAAHGGFCHVTFAQDGGISVQPITLPRELITELSSHLMLFFTGIKRTASDVAKSYVPDVERLQAPMRTIGEMVSEALSALARQHDVMQFGKLLHHAWQIKRSLSPEVTNDRVEEIYEEGMRAGAVGGKLLGAGGGGFMLLFVPPAQRGHVLERLKGLVHVPFQFQHSGSQIIFYEPEEDFSVLETTRSETR